jgi:ribose 5-phosphate isomerase B
MAQMTQIALAPQAYGRNAPRLMTSYDIITEADARTIAPGSTVILKKGGHVTPLAADTLRARRVTVIGETPDVDLVRLAPVADVRAVAIGSDHSGVALKTTLVAYLRTRGLAVTDVGTHGSDPVDYPDIAAQVARLVARREADAGIVIDGAGLGSAIAANKIDGIRAAMCNDRTLATYARQHNGANVLTLGATLLTTAEATSIIDTWISTPTREERYLRRLAKIQQLERSR